MITRATLSLGLLLFPFFSFSFYVVPDSLELKISFPKGKEKIAKEYSRDVTKIIELDIKGLSKGRAYSIKVKANNSKTSIASSEYEVHIVNDNFKASSESEEVFVVLNVKQDSIPDRTRELVLELDIKSDTIDLNNENKGDHKFVVISVEGHSTINSLNYLAHIGTNFDLVDGIQPKNLFFATNFFIPARESKLVKRKKVSKKGKEYRRQLKFGTYFSLYGNRSFSTIDSTRIPPRNIAAVRDIDSLILTKETFNRISNSSTDNIGAQVSFPLQIGQFASSSKKTKFWPQLSFEFIWRRSKEAISFNAAGMETTVKDIFDQTIFDRASLPTNYTRIDNIYEFNYGIGFFTDHTTDDISIRFNWSVGSSSAYEVDTNEDGEKDIYFSGKLYVIEPKSGLTLHADVYNRLKNPQPYYVVTLSKAFSLSSLGKILQPLSSR